MAKINPNEVIDKSRWNSFFTMVFVLTFIALIFSGYNMNVYGTTLPLMMEELGLTPTETGFLASVSFIGMLIGAIVFGMLADIIGRRAIVILSIVLYSVFTGLCAFAYDATLFGIFRFFAGLGMGALTPITTTIVSEYSPKSVRNLILSINGIGIPVGQIIPPLLGIFLLQSIGWRTFYLLAFIPVVIAILIYFYLPESLMFYEKKGQKEKIVDILKKANPDFKPSPEDEYITGQNVGGGNLFTNFAGLFEPSLRRNTFMIWLMFFVNLYIAFGILTWLPQLMQLMGYSLGSGLTFLLMYSIMSFISSPIAGRIADRFGFKVILLLAYIIPAVMFVVLTIPMSTALFTVVFIVMAFFSGYQQTLTYALAAQSYPVSLRGTAVGWGSSIARLGSFFAPIIVGALIEANIPVTTTFATFAVPALLGAIAITIWRPAATTSGNV